MRKSYIYTETAFHHEGDMQYLKDLIDASKTAGANGVKFQVLTNISDFVSSQHSAFETLKKFCFSYNQWVEIFEYTKEVGLDIIMMPLNLESIKLIEKFNVRYLDIHSVSFYDSELMSEIKKTNIEVILGVGGRTVDEIIEKISFFGSKLKILMVGFQSFPSQLEDVKIGKIAYLKEMFPDCMIGYADHSSFDHEHAIKSNEYARILGASFFEKHITKNEGVERVDFSAAVCSQKIKEIIDRIEFIEEFILTDYINSFELNSKEFTYRNRQLCCVAITDLPVGTIIEKEHIKLKLTDSSKESFNRIEDLVGKRVKSQIYFDSIIMCDFIE